MTIDAEDVVQRTVELLPAGLDDVRVVAEEDIDVPGATVAPPSGVRPRTR